MGIKGKIKGSYLYTQWKLGKYTKRRVKHSHMDDYSNYYDDNMGNGYPISGSSSYSHPSERTQYSYSNQNNSYNQSYDDTNNYHPTGTYNRMAYYPTMEERQEY